MRKLERMATGLPGLDTVLRDGVVRGAAYVLHGPPGAGKTILANQMCFHRAALGERALYVSLFTESHDRMLAYLDSMAFFRPEAVPDRVFYMSVLRTLEKDGLDALLRLLDGELRRHQPTLMVLDGLFAIRDYAERDLEFRTFIHQLHGLTSLVNTTLLLLTNASMAAGAPEYTMVDGHIELRDDPFEARAIRSLIVHKQRGDGFVRGRHEFDITDQGITVYPRLEATLTRAPAGSSTTERVGSGVADLDTMLRGGYPASSTTLLVGPSGSGKTTLGLQFLAGATPEQPGLLFGFYETPNRLETKARSIGIDLKAMVESGALEILWQPLAENLLDQLGHRLIDAIERRPPRRVVIDSLDGFAAASVHPNRLPTYMNALNNALHALEVTAVYTKESHELALPDRLSIGNLSGLVDNVIMLHYTLCAGITRRNVSILKVRDSDFDPLAREYYIGGAGLLLGDRLTDSGKTQDS